MMGDFITLADFRAGARAGRPPESGVMRLATSDPAVVAGEARTLRFTFSDGTVDRAGDSIDPAGWDLAGFVRNPVALWAHDSVSPPIGRAGNITVEGNRLMGDIAFAPPETYDFADTIYRLTAGGYIRAVSVGFNPLEWTFVNDKDRPWGIDFKRQELLEISLCPVPCNANALIEARAKGIDTRPLVAWAERILDGGANALVPRGELDQLRRAAAAWRKDPSSGVVSRSDAAADWQCGAARDLPIGADDAWDGGAAEASIFAHAGGDTFDPAVAKKGFLAYDAAAPKLRGSYKLPFARVAGGTIEAAPAGIRAAASRLPDTAISDSCKTSARAVIDHYEARMKEGKTEPAPHTKSGRRISADNAARLVKAMEHIQSVLDSNEPGEPDVDDPAGNPATPAVGDGRALTPRQAARLRVSSLLD